MVRRFVSRSNQFLIHRESVVYGKWWVLVRKPFPTREFLAEHRIPKTCSFQLTLLSRNQDIYANLNSENYANVECECGMRMRGIVLEQSKWNE